MDKFDLFYQVYIPILSPAFFELKIANCVSKKGIYDGNKKMGTLSSREKGVMGVVACFLFVYMNNCLLSNGSGVQVSPGVIQIIPYNFRDCFISYFN